jgi:hypothetical protein
MPAKTLYVYREDGGWAVKKEGKSAKVFATQREAVDAARGSLKNKRARQVVVYEKNGEVMASQPRGVNRIQSPPRKSALAGRIRRAVGKVALDRVQSRP